MEISLSKVLITVDMAERKLYSYIASEHLSSEYEQKNPFFSKILSILTKS